MYRSIMVPLDGSQLAECVFPHLNAFIKGFAPERLLLVRVVEPISISSAIQASEMEIIKKNEEDRVVQAGTYLEAVRRRLDSGDSEVSTIVPVGMVADALVDLAGDEAVDLILIATHGRSGISRWVRGSVADRILHSARVPVVMVRALPER